MSAIGRAISAHRALVVLDAQIAGSVLRLAAGCSVDMCGSGASAPRPERALCVSWYSVLRCSALSAAVLAVGAELFAEHAAAAGRRVGVTALAVGLLVAGAEPEEMITAAIASARHHPGIALGDALGANVTMLTLVLGSIAVLVGLPLSARVAVMPLGRA